VGTLRLVDVPGMFEKHEGEVYSCAFTPDGACVLSAGWDGFVRLWDTATGTTLTSLHASAKPLSSCVSTPDGTQWLTGSMEGMLAAWDGVSHSQLFGVLGHTRPISDLCYSPDRTRLASASWDRQVVLRKAENPRDGKVLGTHHDIVAGCRFVPDGSLLLSWSHDGSIKLWHVEAAHELATLKGHADRVTCLAVSPDGRMALSGSRDSTLRLWDLDQLGEIATVSLGAEVRACFLLLDGESAVVTDSVGRVFLMRVPTFEVVAQLQLPFRAMCGAMSPTGAFIALGGEDGVVHILALDGMEETSIVVTATQCIREEAGFFGSLFGSTRQRRMFSVTCPACRHVMETHALPPGPFACPQCKRRLKAHTRVPMLQGQ
jgi:WD40 repeat protein